MRYLIVDDEPINLRFLTALLKPFAECVPASSGDQAIEIFRRSLEQNTPFDAVFMDIMMPDMDGHMAAERLREIEREMKIDFLQQFKLIMVTALSDVSNVTRSFFKGNADLYVTKPIDAQKLISDLRILKLVAS